MEMTNCYGNQQGIRLRDEIGRILIIRNKCYIINSVSWSNAGMESNVKNKHQCEKKTIKLKKMPLMLKCHVIFV